MARGNNDKLSMRDLIVIGKAYQRMGGAVQEQLDKLYFGEYEIDNCNRNALKIMRDFSGTMFHQGFLDGLEAEDFSDWVTVNE